MLPCGCTVSLQSPPSLTVLSDFFVLFCFVLGFVFCIFFVFFCIFLYILQHSIPTYYACILLFFFVVFFVFSLYMYTDITLRNARPHMNNTYIVERTIDGRTQ